MKYSGLALQMLVTIGLAVAVGYFLDTKTNLLPLFTLLFTFGSLASVIYWLIRSL